MLQHPNLFYGRTGTASTYFSSSNTDFPISELQDECRPTVHVISILPSTPHMTQQAQQELQTTDNDDTYPSTCTDTDNRSAKIKQQTPRLHDRSSFYSFSSVPTHNQIQDLHLLSQFPVSIYFTESLSCPIWFFMLHVLCSVSFSPCGGSSLAGPLGLLLANVDRVDKGQNRFLFALHWKPLVR